MTEKRTTAMSVDDAARHWAEAGAPHVLVVLHFGSTRSGASPDPRSAHDFILVVDEYLPFYRAFHSRSATRRSPDLLAALNRVLAPNVLHGVGPAGEAKLFVISSRAISQAVSSSARDQFVRGRLCQDVGTVFVRDEAARALAAATLSAARNATVSWVRPFLSARFDAARFARRMIEVSYRSEIRPEGPARAHEVFESQRPFFAAAYEDVFLGAAAGGTLRRQGHEWEYVRPVNAWEHFSARAWFTVSRVRATLRWAKYLVTFDDWLGYIAAKVERRTGTRVELTPNERRWPLLLLWPKFFRVMKARRPANGRSS